MTKKVYLHLVSHASGELVEMLARNAVAQLADVEIDRTLWKMVRNIAQLPEILAEISAVQGIVLHSIADPAIRRELEEGCQILRVPCLFALQPFVDDIAHHYGAEVRFRHFGRDEIFEDYYRRVEAMKFALSHDDGVNADDLEGAEVILIGVSRATKTPTCMYLASRGIKAANVPLVPDVPLPDSIARARDALIVGLTIEPNRLVAVRTARLASLSEDRQTDYSDLDRVNDEVRQARRLFARHGWPQIDVTTRSIEQTASMILDMLEKRRAASQPIG